MPLSSLHGQAAAATATPAATAAAAATATPVAVATQATGHAPGAALHAITLTGFRNYESFSLALEGDCGAVILTGANGAGKTNLLEAISLLAPGRGLRRARNPQLARNPQHGHACAHATANENHHHAEGAGGWSVSARVETAAGIFTAGTGVTAADLDRGKSRIIRIDGETVSQTELGTRLAVAWLTPEMDQVLAASPGRRRQFLDRLVIAFDPAHNGRLARHEKAARERARLLDEGSGDTAWLAALEAEIAASAVAIIAARKSMTEALDAEAATPVPVFPRARLRLEGEAENWMEESPALEVEDRIRREAALRRRRGEASLPGAGGSLLIATHPANGAEADMCSTGEQKALVISVVLAHARLQARRLSRPPILLLDDIASHLDEAARHALYDLTHDLPGQVWFSSTDAAVFAPIHHRARHVPLAAGKEFHHDA